MSAYAVQDLRRAGQGDLDDRKSSIMTIISSCDLNLDIGPISATDRNWFEHGFPNSGSVTS